MKTKITRRDFLAASAALGTGLAAAGRLEAAPFKTTLKKALIGTPDRKTLESWKTAGFDGIEVSGKALDMPLDQAAEARKMAEQMGMKIHSVLRGWMNFNSPDKAVVEQDIAHVEKALRVSQAFGADALLVVPCKLPSDMAMPAPWDFDIEFDEKTGMVKRVVQGDNAKYAAYIEAQNYATKASRQAVRKLIPAAEKTGVVIALENVWNNLWVQPALLANFIARFDNPWVQCYFDIGNHVKYARPEEWLQALGKLIVKLHVKDFIIDRSNPRGGKFVDIRDGDVNWPAVRQEIDRIGHSGWLTIEGSGGLPLEEQNKRLDLIIAGK